MINAKDLRNKDTLNIISKDKPGYYKWWASKETFEIIAEKLDVDISTVTECLDIKNGYYCIYVGVAVNESVRARVNWHINDSHTPSKVRNRTLSTLRQSISSIVAHDQYAKEATNDFIDKLQVEYFYVDLPIRSKDAKDQINDIERNMMREKLYLLNIKENYHPAAKDVKYKLKKIRKESRREP